jgi:hypothetical protein
MIGTTGDIIPIVIALAVACPISWTTAGGRMSFAAWPGWSPEDPAAQGS